MTAHKNYRQQTTIGGTMNRIAVLLTALLIGFGALASPAQADGGAEVDRLKIVAAGDSIVDGAGAGDPFESWPDFLGVECGAGCEVKNVGRGGSCLVATGCWDATSLIDSFDRDVLSKNPDVVIVGIGRNDLCHASTHDLIDGYRVLRAKARAAGVRIHFATITPAGQAWQWPCEEQRIEVNTWLRTLKGTLDFERRVSTPRGLLRAEYDYDGLHLNSRGYEAMGRLANRAING